MMFVRFMNQGKFMIMEFMSRVSVYEFLQKEKRSYTSKHEKGHTDREPRRFYRFRQQVKKRTTKKCPSGNAN